MILPLLILAAQVSSAPNSPKVPPGSGSELMVQCVAAEGMALGSASASGDQVEKGALCIGYVEGYTDAAKADVCIPPRSLMAVINSYLMYMKDNPKYYEIPKAAGLRASIDATYPCKK
jgi:Rap1a immunity proteins